MRNLPEKISSQRNIKWMHAKKQSNADHIFIYNLNGRSSTSHRVTPTSVIANCRVCVCLQVTLEAVVRLFPSHTISRRLNCSLTNILVQLTPTEVADKIHFIQIVVNNPIYIYILLNSSCTTIGSILFIILNIKQYNHGWWTTELNSWFWALVHVNYNVFVWFNIMTIWSDQIYA